MAVEFDVKLSADGHVVVMHDATVDRTTDGQGHVHRMSLAALKELDAGSSFSPDFRGEKIPTLAEVFAEFGTKLFMNVELTNFQTPFDDLVPRVTTLIREHHLESHVLFSSFLSHNLRKAARLMPEVPRGLLAWRGWLGAFARSFLAMRGSHAALHPHVRDVDQGLVDRAHNRGKRVHVYTVNDPQEMRRLRNWGVDGIFTDDPGLALTIFGSEP